MSHPQRNPVMVNHERRERQDLGSDLTSFLDSISQKKKTWKIMSNTITNQVSNNLFSQKGAIKIRQLRTIETKVVRISKLVSSCMTLYLSRLSRKRILKGLNQLHNSKTKPRIKVYLNSKKICQGQRNRSIKKRKSTWSSRTSLLPIFP